MQVAPERTKEGRRPDASMSLTSHTSKSGQANQNLTLHSLTIFESEIAKALAIYHQFQKMVENRQEMGKSYLFFPVFLRLSEFQGFYSVDGQGFCKPESKSAPYSAPRIW